MFLSVMRSFNVNFDVNFDNFNELFYIGCPYALYFVAEKNWNICGRWKRDDAHKLNEP